MIHVTVLLTKGPPVIFCGLAVHEKSTVCLCLHLEGYLDLPLSSIPSNNEKARYGPIHLQREAFVFDMFDFTNSTNVFKSETPMSMEYVGQVCDFCSYWCARFLLFCIIEA